MNPGMEFLALPPPDLYGPSPESEGLEENKADRCVLRVEGEEEDREALI